VAYVFIIFGGFALVDNSISFALRSWCWIGWCDREDRWYQPRDKNGRDDDNYRIAGVLHHATSGRRWTPR
jgi:hypothetical protein